MTKEERIALARKLRADGYNCSQCVAMAFADKTGLEPELLARVSHGFGSGIGGRKETCGVVTGMTMVVSAANPDIPRKELYDKVSQTVEKFVAEEGSDVCAVLKRPGAKPCVDLIADAVGRLHDHLEKE
ncbi:MAG: C-GCAxxG-C-C family protein [Duncaniella sp.]|nr:C-GCAxxG-C-C family protein [Duncaniella sp.]